MPTRSDIPTTREKALQMNLDHTKYGTFAEIGAGQETAGWFFRVGGASGTVAKSISAYDMQMSDAIYGTSPRYVSRGRLRSMLDHEFPLLTERLHEKRGADTTFFAFANTVRARAYRDKDGTECHGWMGIRYMTEPGGPPHEILIHCRMFDPSNLEQQRHLGILGVNLVYAAFFYRQHLETFVESLLDELSHRVLEVDMLKFSGPQFTHIDNRECALMLVEKDLTDAAFFSAEGEVMQASEKLYKQPVLVLRGSFNPVTRVGLDILNSARATFQQHLATPETSFVEVMEFSMNSYFQPTGELGQADFLRRADILQALGKNVLISKFNAFHRLAAYLSQQTTAPIALTLSVDVFEKLFQETYYDDLPGGILESVGRLFKNSVRLYIYPMYDRETQTLRTAEQARIAPQLQHLLAFLVENHKLVSLTSHVGPELLQHWTTDVRKMMDAGLAQWKTLVPEELVPLYEAQLAEGLILETLAD